MNKIAQYFKCQIFFFFSILLFSRLALGAEVYTTFPTSYASGGACLDGSASPPRAVGVSVPAGEDYKLNSVRLVFYGSIDEELPFTIEVYDDNAGVPGSLVATVATVTTTVGVKVYTPSPTAAVMLQAGEKYWVVGSSSSTDSYCKLSWAYSTTDPAGSVFSFEGQKQFDGSSWVGLSSSDYLTLRIDADPISSSVAEPAAVSVLPPWALLVMAIGMVLLVRLPFCGRTGGS